MTTLFRFQEHSLTCKQLCLLHTNQLANSWKACVETYAPKKAQISVQKEKHTNFKHHERLGYQQVLGYAQISQH